LQRLARWCRLLQLQARRPGALPKHKPFHVHFRW
jgi:hypothetical protein